MQMCTSIVVSHVHRIPGGNELMPITVGAKFEQNKVHILEMPMTEAGIRYVLVFLGYLTTWIEAIPLLDKASESIALWTMSLDV